MQTWRRSPPGSRNSRYKGPVAATCMPDLFEEQHRGSCGWSGGREGRVMAERREAASPERCCEETKHGEGQRVMAAGAGEGSCSHKVFRNLKKCGRGPADK